MDVSNSVFKIIFLPPLTLIASSRLPCFFENPVDVKCSTEINIQRWKDVSFWGPNTKTNTKPNTTSNNDSVSRNMDIMMLRRCTSKQRLDLKSAKYHWQVLSHWQPNISINSAFTDVHVTHDTGTNTSEYHHWLLNRWAWLDWCQSGWSFAFSAWRKPSWFPQTVSDEAPHTTAHFSTSVHLTGWTHWMLILNYQ